jgi:hypothetical protein
MAFVPRDKLTNIVGNDKLTDYQFGKRMIHHVFCSVCGIHPFGWGVGGDGRESAMINVRCLDGVDAHTLSVANQFDGKSLL